MNTEFLIEYFDNFETIKLPKIHKSFFDYFIFIFILFLLYGLSNSVFGISMMLQKVHGPSSTILVVILLVLLLIGVFFLGLVYLILRPVVQQKIELHKNYLKFDSGALPLSLRVNLRHTIWHSPSELPHVLKTCFRKKYQFDIENLKLLRINGFYDPVRLTIKSKSSEVEIGRQLNELDKIWLLNLIKSYYRI